MTVNGRLLRVKSHLYLCTIPILMGFLTSLMSLSCEFGAHKNESRNGDRNSPTYSKTSNSYNGFKLSKKIDCNNQAPIATSLYQIGDGENNSSERYSLTQDVRGINVRLEQDTDKTMLVIKHLRSLVPKFNERLNSIVSVYQAGFMGFIVSNNTTKLAHKTVIH